MKIIPTKVHGVLDYLMAATMFALPRVTSNLGWSQSATTFLMVMAIMAFLYSLLTRYELGLLKLLPMPGHLILDFLSGAALVAAPFVFLQENSTVTTIFVVLGVMEVGVSLLTQTTPALRTQSGSTRTT